MVDQIAPDEITSSDRLGGELVRLPLGDVVPSSSNPRLTLDKEPFAELKRSIWENGLLQPIVVRPVGDRYEIIGGHRRFAAVIELAREHPDDPRFNRIAAMVVDVDEAMVGVLQLAENVNRADLAPIEVAEGVAAAMARGASPEDVAAGLGWNRRQLNRYLQIHEAPAWLREFAREVKAPKARKDERGAALIDPVTQRPIVDVETHAGLAFSHLFELVTAFNVLKQADAERLAEGGDGFKPRAERVVRRLAAGAAAGGWGVARLRTEIKTANAPALPKIGSDAKSPAPTLAVTRGLATLNIDQARATTGDARDKLTAELTALLMELRYRVVVLKA